MDEIDDILSFFQFPFFLLSLSNTLKTFLLKAYLHHFYSEIPLCILKRNLGWSTISISNLHQQLKFDNFLFLIHTKWFVLITKFLAGGHLEMWRSCVAVPDSHPFIAIVFFIESRDWHYNASTSHFKMAARRKLNDQNNSLGVN